MTAPTPGPCQIFVDARGVSVSAASAGAVEALDRAVLSFVGHHADLGARLDRALALDPRLVRALVLRATATRLSGRTSDLGEARAWVERARASAHERGATAAEHALVLGLEAWCARDADRALAELERAIDAEPRDLFALKASHALHFMLGRSRAMRSSLERALPAWTERRLPGRGALLGCHAFSLIETGENARGERVGRDACELEDNPWSLHSVAHALHVRGEAAEGAAWLAANEPVLEGVGSLALHVRWHAAVFAIARGRAADALVVYDRWLAARLAPDYRDFVNAASLLLRLERAGIDVGERWAPLCAVAEGHGRDHGLAFADVHYAMALWAGGRSAALAAHLASLERISVEVPGVDGRTLREVGAPLVRALAAARTSAGEARRLLEKIEPHLPRLGGSGPQREVFAVLGEVLGARERAAAPLGADVRPGRVVGAS